MRDRSRSRSKPLRNVCPPHRPHPALPVQIRAGQGDSATVRDRRSESVPRNPRTAACPLRQHRRAGSDRSPCWRCRQEPASGAGVFGVLRGHDANCRIRHPNFVNQHLPGPDFEDTNELRRDHLQPPQCLARNSIMSRNSCCAALPQKSPGSNTVTSFSRGVSPGLYRSYARCPVLRLATVVCLLDKGIHRSVIWRVSAPPKPC